MNYILSVLFFIAISLRSGQSAPAYSSVHVRFVTGNKATQYSHGSLGDGTNLDYNVVGPDDTPHEVRKRSLLVDMSPSSSTSTTTISSNKPKLRRRTKNGKKSQIGSSTTSKSISGDTKDKNLSLLEPHPTDETLKPKDSKAVKRSPYNEPSSFATFDFPDFDEFGGNGFGSLSNFGHAPPESHDRQHGVTHGLNKAESLAPDGLFLPPIPTAASNHVDDPYLADAESAKYASQHPPYFHEFPHKRNVLALNEIREENGLERNLLRSIRPFFPFFEINNIGVPYLPFPSYRLQPGRGRHSQFYNSYLGGPSHSNYYDGEESKKLPKITLAPAKNKPIRGLHYNLSG